MHPVFHVPERGALALLLDRMVYPRMKKLFEERWGESPQLTHVWNNMQLPRESADHLYRHFMVHCNGDPDAVRRKRRIDVRFHLGGWKKFVVLEPTNHEGRWYVGWVTKDGCGASQIPVRGRVRMLIGPDDTEFFGVRTDNYGQINIRAVDGGELGDRGPYRMLPLH